MKARRTLLICIGCLLLVVSPCTALAQTAELANWQFMPDRDVRYSNDNLPAADSKDWRPILVGQSWNAQFDDLRDYMGVGWYRASINLAKPLGTQKALLRFGAVDYFAEVFLNGKPVGQHEGGYTPFAFEISSALRAGQNELLVRVVDPPMSGPEADRFSTMRYNEIPHGKQDWYVQTGGIWQPVELSIKPATHIESVKITPEIDGRFTATVRLSAVQQNAKHNVEIVVRDGSGRIVSRATKAADAAEVTLAGRVASPKLWSAETPNLYKAEVTLDAKTDKRIEVFGFRKFEAKDGKLYLNGKPYYMIGALDQDFYPDTIYTAPSKEYIRDQMLKGKRMGLNMLRCHIKVCEPSYLEVADEVGMLVWYEVPSWDGGYHFTKTAAARGERIFAEMVERDWNHPSIVIQSVINESWGADLKQADQREWLKAAYDGAKKLVAPLGRLVVDNSACCSNFHVKTDIDDFHQYYSIPDNAEKWNKWVADFASRPKWSFSPHGDAERTGSEPLIVSEFGNWGLPKLPGKLPWWFDRDFAGRDVTRPAGVLSRFEQYKFNKIFADYNSLAEATQWHQFASLKHEIEEMRQHPSIQGYVITEFTDINWEVNGLMDMWRNPKAYAAELAKIQQPDVVLARLPRHNFYGAERVQVPVLISRYSGTDFGGASLRWRTSQGAQGTITLPLAGDSTPVTKAADISFDTVAVQRPTPVTLSLEVIGKGGRKLAENSYKFYVYPQTKPAEVRVSVVGNDENLKTLRAALAERGVAVADAPQSGSVAIGTRWSSELEQFAKSGGRVVLFANSAEALPKSWPIKIQQRAGSDLDGNWVTNFNWVRKSSTPFAQVAINDILSFEAASVTPEFLIRGVQAADYDDVLAGTFYGWLNENSAVLYQARFGEGSVLATTFTFARYSQDPFATALLDQLVAYAAGSGMQPKSSIPVAAAAAAQ